jgi:hypothetical protein
MDMRQHRLEHAQALRLVEHHRTGVGLEKTLEIRGQDGEVGRALEVKVSPSRPNMARESALAGLTWSDKEHS